MPRLLNIRTNLSDYQAPKYGYDRRGAGPRNTNASGQPYEVENIPKRSFNTSDFGKSTGPQISEDFLLRGGTLVSERIVKDVSRLEKMFFDTRSPNGLLFTSKQEVLSRTGVNVLATSTNSADINNKNRRAFNNGIYLPTSTLAQAAVNPLGGHLLKQGLDPTADTGPDGGILGGVLNDLFNLNIQDPLGNPTYFSTVAYREKTNNNTSSRLVGFLKNNLNGKNGSTELYNYSGGPGSILGVGKTRINILNDQRTGRNNAILDNSNFFGTENFGYFNYSVFKNPRPFNFQGAKYFQGTGVSGNYENVTGTNLFGPDLSSFKTTNDAVNGGFISKVGQSVFKVGGFQANNDVPKGLGTTLNYDQLMNSGTTKVLNKENNYNGAQLIQDFRTKTDTDSVTAPSYIQGSKKRYEARVNLGEAGAENQSTSYVKGNGVALDKINELPLYKSSNVDILNKDINDLCKFRIGVIDNDNPSLKTYIHFRAFLDGMDDSYTADWSSQKFSGRAENFYNYGGFDRNFNLSWTVVAQSKQELMPMYQKLNYLASACAPDYSKDGYMRGNLVELTIGGYLFNQVGIMKGIQYTIPMDSPWEIAINSNGDPDQSVKELPFMIKVSGFNFIPIHNFVPNVQKNTFRTTNEENGSGVKGDISTFGDEKYISLSNGFFGDGYKDAKSLEKDEEANEFVRSEQGQQIISETIETLNTAL